MLKQREAARDLHEGASLPWTLAISLYASPTMCNYSLFKSLIVYNKHSFKHVVGFFVLLQILLQLNKFIIATKVSPSKTKDIKGWTIPKEHTSNCTFFTLSLCNLNTALTTKKRTAVYHQQHVQGSFKICPQDNGPSITNRKSLAVYPKLIFSWLIVLFINGRNCLR